MATAGPGSMAWMLLLLAVLSVLDVQHIGGFVIRSGTGGLRQALFAALTFHINLLEAQRGYLPPNWDVLWSLSVEESFYLCLPLICRALGRGKVLASLLLIFVMLGPIGRTVLSHGNPIWHEYSYLGSMDAIALGCLTAMALSRYRLSGRALRLCGVCGATLLVAVLGFSTHVDRWGLGRGFGSFSAAGKPLEAVPVLFVAVILASTLLGELTARLSSDPLNRVPRSGLRRVGGGAVAASAVERSG